MYLQSKQYYLVLSSVIIRIPAVLVVFLTIVLQLYSCTDIYDVDSIRNISSSLNLNFNSGVPESISDMYQFPKVLNGQNTDNIRPRPVSLKPKAQVPLATYKNTTNRIGVVQQHHKPSNYSVMTLVRNIDIRLKSIRNVELGLATIQEIFDVIQFSAIVNKTNDTLFQFSKRLSEKLQKASKIIFQMKRFFEKNVTSILSLTGNSHFKNVHLDTVILPCPLDDINLEPNYDKRQIQILNYLEKNRASDNNISNSVNYKILDEFRKQNIESYNFKQIFYLSAFDHASDNTCLFHSNTMPFRWLYASAVPRKCFFILFDIGSALTVDQIELSKTYVSNIVKMLGPRDMISIVTLSDEALPMTLIHSNGVNTKMSNMYLLHQENKEEVIEYINGLKRSSEMTNHSLGFEYAFRLLGQYNLSTHNVLEFVYVTRGLLTRLSDAKTVLSIIAQGQQNLSHPIVINACAVILDEKRIMYEKQFLIDIVHQNYSKYEIDVGNWSENHLNLKGNLYIITKRHPEKIIRTSTAIFTDLLHRYLPTSNNLQVHHPTIDNNNRDAIIPMIHAIPKFGVVGVNLYLSDLAEDIINYKDFGDSYACLIDTKGFAIVHPALQSSFTLTKIPAPVDIAYLEKSADFLKVRKNMLSEKNGNDTISVSSYSNFTKTYTWNRVMEIYIICIVTTAKSTTKDNPASTPYLSRLGNSLNKFQHTEYSIPVDLLYHRIDLISPQTPVCRYFRQIATLDTSTVFLSASSFQSPFTYMKNNHFNCDNTKTHTVQSIMAYIKDSTGLLANPGLLPRIRNDVNVLYSVMEHLKKRHLESGELKNYIIRRYAATISGVIQVYPGCVLRADLEPSQRPWYRKAMQHPGRIVITEPYLDAGGAGYILTIAHTIFEGKANALHNYERDSPVAIIALDVPYAFFYKILLDSSVCQEKNIKCILFENEGYLIAHPSMMEPAHALKNMRRPREHLTHKESFLANDILNHKILVTKLACVNYPNRTIQRYYAFNTSLTDVVTNVVHGERSKYQIMAVRGTNIFAAILNSTCDGGAFCPCSTVDRICLNCKRMDQTDCECPCECPMHIKPSEGLTPEDDEVKFLDSYESHAVQYGYCETPPDTFYNSQNYDWNMVLNSCIHINCDMYVTHVDCLAVMGCEWCQIDLDGNPFSASFCTTQNSCFNGVLSSLTPYGDGDIGSTIIEQSKPQPYSTVGPIGGAIIVLCLVIGFAMYCYRQSLENGSDQFYVDSTHDDNYGVPLSRFNFDNIPPPEDGDMDLDSPSDGHGAMHCSLVHPVGNAIVVPDISPYHMSTGSSYRRPPNGESDHGYSTMTPHEDSEHMCFTLAEPLINNKRLSKSDSLSISTSVSSPTNQNNVIMADRPVSSMGVRVRSSHQRHNEPKNNSIYSQTILVDCNKESDDQQQLSPHHVLARVTVHRHMEAL